jgi:hypothetical protein
MVLTLLSSAIAFGQHADHGACPLASGANGQKLTVRGKITTGAHDMLLVVSNCEQSAVLVYAGDSETNVPAERLRQDQNLERFKKYTEATYKSTGKDICLQCSRYEVEASLTGQLDIALIPEGAKRDQLGFLRDEAGKIVGKAGFGHPTPLYKYRLVIESVSDVTARELPRPKTPNNEDPKSLLLHESGHAQVVQGHP